MILNLLGRHDGHSISENETNILMNVLVENDYSSLLVIGTYKGWAELNAYNIIVEEKKGYIDTVDLVPDDEPVIHNEYWTRERTLANYNSNLKFIKDNNLINFRLHNKGADDFFTKNDKKYDFILIHGSHITEQVGRDVYNAWKCLNADGMIFIHPMISRDSWTNPKSIFDNFDEKGCSKKYISTDYRGFGVITKNRDGNKREYDN